jgi:CheY-like chemotaxis protein
VNRVTITEDTMNGKRILLVDDDVDFVEVNRAALEGAGYEVCTAHDGREALKVAAAMSPHAAVLDVIMTTPQEGFELARALRKNPATSKVPLVMLTSINTVNAEKGSSFRFSERDRDEMWLPIDRFLDKPVQPQVLVGVVRELVG